MLYRETSPPILAAEVPAGTKGSMGWQLAVMMAILVAVAGGTGYIILRRAHLPDSVEITAHRAGAAHGPENTIGALKQAIVQHADWAEIDVQLTQDEKLVVMHDTDLARVGGGNRQVAESMLADIQALDVGTSFNETFRGEQIPTFAAFLTAARDQIHLNVELKPHGKSDAEPLTLAVLDEIRKAKMVDQCRICSQSYEGLQIVRQAEPTIPVGYIVATAIGDPTELDVDFLMVKQQMANRKFVERARARNIAVHAWTINDASDVIPLVQAGVANIITDDPPLIQKQLAELQQLSTVDQVLLQVRARLTK